MTSLDLFADPVVLSAALVDIESPSHHEEAIADAIEAALRGLEHAEVQRFGNTVVARTSFGLDSRVVLAGHIDTVPLADNTPHRLADGILHGCGSVDMKSGLACYLHAFATLAQPGKAAHDLTLIAYEGEEVAQEYNGLYHLERDHPELLQGDIALLGEPSGAIIEAGCQGTIRVFVDAHGTRAHSARSWLGHNAAHDLAGVLTRIAAYEPRTVLIDDCEYREGLNVVGLEGFVATNTIPDHARLIVNFRYAPDRSVEDAKAHLEETLALEEGLELIYDDVAPGALPGLGDPVAAGLVKAVGGNFRAKFGWTDVARFSSLGVPAVNFGPGDPGFAHKKDEQCPVDEIRQVAAQLLDYLSAESE
ncbi:succinyldiaminopimelate desuccinylase [Corynebacterium coyleae]|uniref:Succinyl-diaminopimelate desuccinylase n=1 Tax=Corynebacterium coyleae TaxID=53374 RepID=A0ABX8KUB9_9CORY|nr:succinyl-diaminopimelate desuccinylase [Corynebacterium coyleae]QXB18137.1 succinyl-diaminopimelate desuccinylase [Corynebacterium coyleae]WJY79604.1 Succinyl-diaminopimelate desuccinylase [Corynebacterium coyleae]SEB86008.1 succinyldiaminopimelate desuccinylase [Corynebacterium coyleae]